MNKIFELLMNIEKDKILHFTISYILFTYFYVIFKEFTLAIIVTLFIGFIKELYDMKVKKLPFDHEDMIANYLGIALAVFITSLNFI